MTSPSQEVKPLTKEERETLAAVATETIAMELQPAFGEIIDAGDVAEARWRLRYEATIRESESRVSPGAAPETNNEPPDESYGNQVGKYGFIRTIGGSYMLVDETEEGRPLARFVNRSAAEEVGRFMARLEAKALLAPSSAPEEATPLRNAAKQAEYELSQIANIAKVSDYTRGRLREIAAMLADAHGESYKGASRSSGEDQTAAATELDEARKMVDRWRKSFADEDDPEEAKTFNLSSVGEGLTLAEVIDNLARSAGERGQHLRISNKRARDARDEIASLKQQVIDSALRAERLEAEMKDVTECGEDYSLSLRQAEAEIARLRADRTALIEGKVRLRLLSVFGHIQNAPWIAERVVDNTGDYLDYPTADEALAAYRASLSPQPAPEDRT